MTLPTNALTFLFLYSLIGSLYIQQNGYLLGTALLIVASFVSAFGVYVISKINK